jgi:hypothetical protein
VYNVGDVRGWALPPGNGAETYNHWAKKNRFQVGDVLGKELLSHLDLTRSISDSCMHSICFVAIDAIYITDASAFVVACQISSTRTTRCSW